MPNDLMVGPESTSASTTAGSVQLVEAAWNRDPNAVAASPLVLRADQLYYWSRVWQAGEAESREDLAVGDVERFTDVRSLMRSLFSADE